MSTNDESQPRAESSAAPSNPMLERSLWVFLGLFIVVVVAASVWKIQSERLTAAKHTPVPAASTDLPPQPVPDFSLVDQKGERVTLASLKGRVWVADFFFTHCTGKCPLITMRMNSILKAVPEDADLKLVSITVDPEQDSSPVLARYAEQFEANDPRWLFLTGDKQAILRLANEGFKLSATDNPSEHSLKLALVDQAGQIRGYYDGDQEESVAELRLHLKRLLDEGGK
jgi:protein SCO1/2